ncbi:carbohydrate kinase [Marinihelvus fidelis]|uniref:Carbohydrate kinase n=1 Tax=Marinihelvus fidelis TaxID=2613842 RepID=A0A5N0T8I8_9GAMM|nr:carbohydrate kinase [Marinihelvus fidelis]KAA9131038.1 carbohydrate kinase [Marinihelvus fidelis]
MRLQCESRGNTPRRCAAGYLALDHEGIETWLVQAIRTLPSPRDIGRIIVVAHGAAAALVRDGRLFAEPMDYEQGLDDVPMSSYDTARDAFIDTGSPALPQGLNLGRQLHALEHWLGPLPDDVDILPWPQYWAWLFSGVASAELTSLGCHTDLWNPRERTFSALAGRRGWDRRMAPIRAAWDALGPVTPAFAERAGLSPECQVFCGLHDSNAALQAALGQPELRDQDATVLSTGTWFIAMHSPAAGHRSQPPALDAQRDSLFNVDIHGRPIASARFMGGREAELAAGIFCYRETASMAPDELLSRLAVVMDKGQLALPGFVPGVGPFPKGPGQWLNRPDSPVDLRVATDLYLALVTDCILDQIDGKGQLLVEGRFGANPVFMAALASLRPDQGLFRSSAELDVAWGALNMITPGLPAPAPLEAVPATDLDLPGLARRWRERAGYGKLSA